MEKTDLLQMAAERQGIFISDMRYVPAYNKRALNFLSKLKMEDYPLPVWEDALGYLANKAIRFPDYVSIKHYIVYQINHM